MNKVPENHREPRFSTLILMHFLGIEAVPENDPLFNPFPKHLSGGKGKMNNYKYCKTIADGKTAFSVCVNGEWAEVSKEVYDFMKADDRRTRYLNQRERAHCVMSLDELIDKSERFDTGIDVPPGLLSPSAEEDFFSECFQISDSTIIELVREQIDNMDCEDRDIATSIILNDESVDSYAKRTNIPRTSLWRKVQSIRRSLYEMCMEAADDEWY